MSRPPSPSLPLASALERSEPLARLLERVQQSRARFEVVRALLPSALQEAVRPGPLDDEGWALLVEHGAAAAKLRQMLPVLQAALAERGWAGVVIKVRIQRRGG
jgi:hypothetical protein